MPITRARGRFAAQRKESPLEHGPASRQLAAPVKLEEEPPKSPEQAEICVDELFFDCSGANSEDDNFRPTETGDASSKDTSTGGSKGRRRYARSSFLHMSRVVKIARHTTRRQELKFLVIWNGLQKPSWESGDFMLANHSKEVVKYLIDLQATKIKSFNPLIDRHQFLGDHLARYLDKQQ